MPAKYWIKMYHETLHDRKIATLDDHLWRRFVETLLLAGEHNEEGYLPPLEDMAWTLRADVEQLETELNELIRIRVLEFRDGKYFVRNFQKRQEPMDKAEYMRRLRAEEQKQEHYQARYQPVTNGNAESDTDTDTDTDIEEEGEAPAFIAMRDMLSEVTGCPPTPGDIKGIEDCVKLGVTREDAEAALQWRKDNLRPAVKTINALIPGIKTNYSMRVQNSNAKPARAGKMSKLEARRRELQDGN